VLLAAPPATEGQQTGKVWRIGYLSISPRESVAHLLKALQEGLRELGYSEGRSVVFEHRFADGTLARLPELAADLVSLRMNIIVAHGATSTRAVKDANRTLIANLAARHRLPAIFPEREFVDAGGLMSYGASLSDQFHRAATYIDKILKGAKPADLPIEQPTKFELVINVKTAKALGLTISPSLLGRADEVIQ